MIENSILKSIRKNLDIPDDCTEYDDMVIMAINSSIMTLGQNGVCPTNFVVTGDDQTWSDLLDGSSNKECAKMYIQLGTRILFDPPSNASVLNAYTSLQKEYLWRLRHSVEEETING